MRIAEEGLPRWFSPEHAGEKFTEIALNLNSILRDMRDGKTRGIIKRLQCTHETAEKYARYYVSECPIQSVRIMQPSGAIYVRLAGGEEVLVPQEDGRGPHPRRSRAVRRRPQGGTRNRTSG
jgi:hypothetical protein